MSKTLLLRTEQPMSANPEQYLEMRDDIFNRPQYSAQQFEGGTMATQVSISAAQQHVVEARSLSRHTSSDRLPCLLSIAAQCAG